MNEKHPEDRRYTLDEIAQMFGVSRDYVEGLKARLEGDSESDE